MLHGEPRAEFVVGVHGVDEDDGLGAGVFVDGGTLWFASGEVVENTAGRGAGLAPVRRRVTHWQ